MLAQNELTQRQPIGQTKALPLVRTVLAARLGPPRPVPWFRFAFILFRRERALRLLLVSAFFSAVWVETFYAVHGGGAEIWFLRLVLAVGGAWIVSAPMWAGLIIASHAREALVTTAEVVEARSGTGRYGEPHVAGRRIVHHPRLGDFRDSFSIGAPWAPAVTRNAVLEVLVAPDERRTWLTLGAGAR